MVYFVFMEIMLIIIVVLRHCNDYHFQHPYINYLQAMNNVIAGCDYSCYCAYSQPGYVPAVGLFYDEIFSVDGDGGLGSPHKE